MTWETERHGIAPPYAQWYPIFALRPHGRFGHWWIFKSYHGNFAKYNPNYPANPNRPRLGGNSGLIVAKYYYPYNPKSYEQVAYRRGFAQAIAEWQAFDIPTRQYYNAITRPGIMSGYNRYIRLYTPIYEPVMSDKMIATVLVAADGTGDYTDIQSGINALPADGGIVFIKNGTYALADKITIAKSNVVLCGQGRATILFLNNTVNKDVIYVGDAATTFSGIEIRGITILGNRANNNSSCGINVTLAVERIIIDNVYIYQTKSNAITLGGNADYSQVTNCKFEDIGDSPLYLTSAEQCLIEGNYFIHGNTVYQYAINLFGANYTNIIGNVFIDSGLVTSSPAISIGDSADVNVISNMIQGHYNAVTIGMMWNPPYRANISDNHIYNCYGDGVFTTVSKLIIKGNFFNTIGGNAIYNMGGDSIISDNHIETCGVNGIYLYSSNNIVEGNQIISCQNNGISVYRAQYNNIINNRIYSSGLATNDTYSDILLSGSVGTNNLRNVIMGNQLVGPGAGNRKKYSIRENDAYCNYNEISHNRCLNSITLEISLQGANTRATENTIT